MRRFLPFCALFLGFQSAFADTFSVRVTDENGAPLEGVRLQIQNDDEEQTAPILTDAAGRASVESQSSPLFPRYFSNVWAWKAGRAASMGALRKNQELELKLSPEAPLGGRVVDGTGAPVANAKIVLERVFTGEMRGLYFGDFGEKFLGVTSGADGTFTLRGVPVGSKASVSVLKPGFARAPATIEAGKTAPITLEVGATLRGKTLDPNGAPVGGVLVTASSGERGSDTSYASARSNAAGEFELVGLRATSHTVSFRAPKKSPLVWANLSDLKPAPSQTLDLGELRAQNGILLSGRVVQSDGKTPIFGATLVVSPGDSERDWSRQTYVSSDETGVWRAFVLPGKWRVRVNQAPPQFLVEPGQTQSKTVVAEKADIGDLDFTLASAPIVRGTIEDEAGKPVKTTLYGLQKYRDFALESDENGAFEGFALQNGKVDLRAASSDSVFLGEGTPAWEVVAPKSFNAPVSDLKIVVKKATPRAIRGFVQDDRGAPLEGVTVEFNVALDNSSGSRKVTSDKAGAFSLPLSGEAKATFQGATKEGYDFVEGGTLVGDTLETLYFSIRDGVLTGRVVDGNGAPIPGALVFAGGGQTESAPDGAFEMRKIAREIPFVTALAGDRLAFVNAPREGVQLRVEKIALAPRDEQLAQEILAGLPKGRNGGEGDDWFSDLAGFEKAWETAKTRTGGDPFWRVGGLLMRAAARPASEIPTANLVDKLAALPESGWSGLFYAYLLSARPEREAFAPHREKILAASEKTLSAKELGLPDEKLRIAFQKLGAVPLLTVLEGEEKGEAALDAAMAWIEANIEEKPADPETPGTLSRSEFLAQGINFLAFSPRLLEKLLAKIPPESRGYAQAMNDAIRGVVRVQGFEAALPLLEKLKNASGEDAKWRWRQSALAAIEKRGQDAPQKALELARSFPKDEGAEDFNERAEAIANAAWSFRMADAPPLFREASELMSPVRAAAWARRILERDPVLARELFEKAKTRFEAQKYDSRLDYRGSQIGVFAFYEADFNPASARFRIEKSWSDPQSGNSTDRFRLVLSLARLDPQRALEWAQTLSKQDQSRQNPDDAKREIARFLRESDAKRATLEFDRYGQHFDWKDYEIF